MADVEHSDSLSAAVGRALAGGPDRHRDKAAEQGKLPVRERVARLLDPDSFSEESLLASWEQEGLGADGTFVNNEGRAQRFFQVFVPQDPIVEAWRWLGLAAARTTEQGQGSRWKNLDDVLNAMAQEIPALKRAPEAAPDRVGLAGGADRGLEVGVGHRLPGDHEGGAEQHAVGSGGDRPGRLGR